MIESKTMTFLDFLLLIACIHLNIVHSAVVKRQTTDLDPDAFLSKFGYLDDLEPGQQHHAEETRAEGIREFQRFNGLNPTGVLDRETFLKMQQPRCGMPDVIKPSERYNGNENRARQHDPTQPLSYNAPGLKWQKNDLTYKVVGYTRQLGGNSQKRAFRNAFSKWSAETPLNFREVTSGNADIEINFARYSHGDGNGNSFDGRGGTLAHAFFPGTQPISGDTHFDEDEHWTMDRDEGTNLEIVAAHEFGHALGLGHSSNTNALMAPFYAGYDPNYKLDYDDKRGIQSLYAHDGNTYAFKGLKIYKLINGGVASGFPQRTRRFFPRSPKSPSAVVYDRTQRKLYMFKGSRYWRYTGFNLDRGYPRPIPTAFRRLKSAFQYSDGRIYLFKTNTYTEWREGMRTTPRGYERSISQYWRGVKPGIEAAFRDSDGSIYFFKGKVYWLYDDDFGYAEPGYPKKTSQAWLGCSPRIPK